MIVSRTLLVIGGLWLAAACAPITPLPGSTGPSMPPSSSGGSPSGSPPAGGSPGGGTPSPSPSGPSGGSSGGQPSSSPPSGGSPGGGPSSGGGGLPGGSLPGGNSLPGGSSGPDGGAPSGSPSGLPGGTDGEGETAGEPSDPTWEEVPPGEGEDGGWQTSNELPGSSGEAGAAGEQSGGSDGGGDGELAGGAQGGGDAELDGALQDFDGEILAEREIITSSPGGTGSDSAGLPEGSGSGTADSDADGDVAGAGIPARRPIPAAPAPPRRGSEGIPDDIADAKDDDIIARQLREAAMQEQDPELQEKLWEEYRKYKNG